MTTQKTKPVQNAALNKEAAVGDTNTDVPSAHVMPTHCPYRQASLLQQALSPDKMRVAFFLGAGCSIPLIPDVAGLTNKIVQSLEASKDFASPFKAIKARLSLPENTSATIEDILTLVRTLIDVAGPNGVDGVAGDVLAKLDQEICFITTQLVSVRLPNNDTAYHKVASWIGAIDRRAPVELFTTNYDLLIEQALEECRVPFFDGFVGSHRPFFDLKSTDLDHDFLPSRWARLWKIHGSINWWRDSSGNVERREKVQDGEYRQMIYPSHLKYDQSRRMPYLAMLDRLRRFLTSGQAVLVTCGYSFSDQHLNEVIMDGLTSNPNAVCFGLYYKDRGTLPPAVRQRIRQHPNFRLLALDGAVFGTLERDWHADPKPEHPLHAIAARDGEVKRETTSSQANCKFLLGDFSDLGQFLAWQLAQQDSDSGPDHAK
ncbi:MAG: SIR2 family protein [Candidatus Hydrogenedentes bacterium]|nr:SIR2 family protein [Candidatus Hydrogenedentota bacterium]